MKEYVKINTIYKRDMANKGRIIEREWAQPEFGYLADNKWIFTEKVDGTNIRVAFDGSTVSFGGRTDAAQIPAFLVDKLNEHFNTAPKKELLKTVFMDAAPDNPIVLYGEGYGARIQSGGNYRADQDFVLFDVLAGEWWLQREDIEDVAYKLGLDVVPIVGEGTLLEAAEMVRNGMKSIWGDFNSEGLVMRPKVELKTRGGHRIIAKIKHRDFIGVKS
jgi:hypothetical protein